MNKKIKVIDLLNKIANGEEVPKRIQIYNRKDSIYEWNSIIGTGIYYYFNKDTHERLGADWKLDGDLLNVEVEILEDNTEEIEELEEWITRRDGEVTQQEGKRLEMCYKINELVKRIKYIERKINE